MLRNIRLKIVDFFSKNKGKIIIFIIGLILLTNLNLYVDKFSEIKFPKVEKTPNIALITDKAFPKKIRTDGVDLIKSFIEKANSKKFIEAAEMLSPEAKKYSFVNRNEAIGFLIKIFPEKMVYDIQAYSNIGNEYVYQVKLFKNPLKTGLTNTRFEYWDGKFVVKEGSKGLELSIRGFVKANDIKGLYEDNNLKVELEKEIIFFDKVKYKVKVSNRTNNVLVIKDLTDQKNSQISLNYSSLDFRIEQAYDNVYLKALESKEFTFEFPKLYLGNTKSDLATTLNFSSVRIFDKYTPIPSKIKIEEDKLVGKKLENYSIKIPIQRKK